MKTRLHTATKAFLTLFLGCLLLLIASLFVFSVYRAQSSRHLGKTGFAINFTKTVRLIHVIRKGYLRAHLHALDGRGFRVSVSQKKLPKVKVIASNNTRVLAQIAKQAYPKILVQIALPNGRYAVVSSMQKKHPWYLAGSIFLEIFVVLLLALLCFRVVKSLSLPLRRFRDAATRFGVDVQSPPMAVSGPIEMQEVITAFNEMQERIRRLLHDRTQMLAAISHDLRTPITRLQLRAEYLSDTKQYEKAIADLNEMEKMISSILSFARDYSSAEVMERFDINALLESLCDDMTDVGHKVNYEAPSKRLVVLGRLSALKRALTNIIDNAIKYGNEVEVVLSEKESTLQIKVSDRGPGIPEDEKEKVFAPFYRVDPARSPEVSGTGLGMAVARDIIRAHGGDIRLLNREPSGLTVVISLPYQKS